MVTLAQLWLPILLSAVFVFFASSLLNMLLRFWHASDYKGFANEDEVVAAIRKGDASPGMYMLPYCKPEAMKEPATQEKFKSGPVGLVFLRRPGPMNILPSLVQWFTFCLFVSFFVAMLASHALPSGVPHEHVLHYFASLAVMAYSFGVIPDAIWWGHPWRSAVKHIIDGIIYAMITGFTFAWLWPGA
jgi:hypothetical protein